MSSEAYAKDESPVYQLIAENYGHIAMNHFADRDNESVQKVLQEYFDQEKLVLNTQPSNSLYYAAIAFETGKLRADTKSLNALLERELDSTTEVQGLIRVFKGMFTADDSDPLEKLLFQEKTLSKIYGNEKNRKSVSSVLAGLELQLAQYCLGVGHPDANSRLAFLKSSKETAKMLAEQMESDGFQATSFRNIGRTTVEAQMAVVEVLVNRLMGDKSNFSSAVQDARRLSSAETGRFQPYVPTYYSSKVAQHLVNNWNAIVSDSEIPSPDASMLLKAARSISEADGADW